MEHGREYSQHAWTAAYQSLYVHELNRCSGDRLTSEAGSNGNPYWTRGPPTSDAVLTVSYVKAYFNSTNTTRISNYNEKCSNPDALQQTCVIPNQEASPDPFGPYGDDTGHTYFFSEDHNKTEWQTIYDNPLDSGAGHVIAQAMPSVKALLVLATCGMLARWA